MLKFKEAQNRIDAPSHVMREPRPRNIQMMREKLIPSVYHDCKHFGKIQKPSRWLATEIKKAKRQ